MKVVLVNPPFFAGAVSTQPGALARLTAWLEQMGHETVQVDLNRQWWQFNWKQYSRLFTGEQRSYLHGTKDTNVLNGLYSTVVPYFGNRMYRLEPDPEIRLALKGWGQEILQHNPDWVGFSLTVEEQIQPSVILSEQLQDVPVVFGGQALASLLKVRDDSTCEPKYQLGSSPIRNSANYFVIGDGEPSLQAVCQDIQQQSVVFQHPNCMRSDGDSPVVRGKVDFSELPVPKYIDDEGYGVLNLEVGQGCYWDRCAFCDHTVAGKPRWMSSRQVVDTLVEVQRQNPHAYIYLANDAIPKKMLTGSGSFPQLLVDEAREVWWNISIRAEKYVTERVADLWAEAGCNSVMVGVEHYSDRVLRKMINKGIGLSQTMRVLTDLTEAGLSTEGGLIVDHPDSSLDEMYSCLYGIQEHEDIIGYTWGNPIDISLDSELYRNPTNYGIEVDVPLEQSWSAKQSFMITTYRRIAESPTESESKEAIQKVLEHCSRHNANSTFESQAEENSTVEISDDCTFETVSGVVVAGREVSSVSVNGGETIDRLSAYIQSGHNLSNTRVGDLPASDREMVEFLLNKGYGFLNPNGYNSNPTDSEST